MLENKESGVFIRVKFGWAAHFFGNIECSERSNA